MKTSRMYVAFIMCVAMGCSKSDGGTGGGTTPPPAPTPTKIQLLTNKDWLLVSGEYKQETATTWIDRWGQLQACSADDHFIFRTDGTYEANDGATKCNASDKQVYRTGTWKFVQNETIITLSTANPSTPSNVTISDCTIEKLDANALIYTYVERVLGVNYIYRETYKR